MNRSQLKKKKLLSDEKKVDFDEWLNVGKTRKMNRGREGKCVVGDSDVSIFR